MELVIFCMRDTMDISSMGVALVETLVEKGYIETIADIYKLHKHREELIKLEGYGKLSNRQCSQLD